MFKKLIDILKAHPRKIVFTEGTDPRILEASARLLSGTFLTPVLLGNEDEVRQAAEDAGFNIRGAMRCVRPPRTPASTSGAPLSSTLRTMRIWMPWWPAWWSCARAR